MKTSKNQINLSWHSSRGSVVIDLRTNVILNYYNDHEKIHELYGGKNYYQSRSGMSGAGLLPNDPLNSAVVFGGYRTTTAHLSEYEVGSYAGFRVLVPADKDSVISYQNPIILEDNRQFWFLGRDEFISFLKRQMLPVATESSERTFTLKYLDEDGGVSTMQYKLHDHVGLCYARTGAPKLPYRFEEYLRAFGNLPSGRLQYEPSANPIFQKIGLAESIVGLVRVSHWSGMAIEIIEWPTDQMINGWRIVQDGDFTHLFRREDVYADNPQVLHLIMMKDTECENSYFQYEETHTLGWMAQPLRAIMDSGARKLRVHIYRNKNRDKIAVKKTMKILENCPDEICCLDHYVGLYGEEFISSLGIPERVSLGELASLENIADLLSIEKFRDIIRWSCEGAPRKVVRRRR